MEAKEAKTNTFRLPNEQVVVKFIKRKKGLAANVNDDHVISGGMLAGSKRRFCAPLTRSNTIANVLTNDEKEYLEKVTDLNLSVYGEFWKTFYVSLFKDDVENRFDLSVPMDYISVKLLRAYTDEIAPSWKRRGEKPTYQFVITGSQEEFKEKKAKLDSKKYAWKYYGKLESNREKLLGILRLLSNQLVAEDAELDWIQGRVEEYLDAKPSSFLEIVEDPNFDLKLLINKGVHSGAILRNNNKFKTIDGLDLCSEGAVPSFDNAVAYLSNPKNQEVRSLIEARIDNSN